MRRIAVLSLVVSLLTGLPAGPATAGESCHTVNAKGEGQALPVQGDGLLRTVAQIRGGGLLQGTTTAAFEITGGTPPVLEFAGNITFSTNRATLTVYLMGGTVDFGTGAFEATGEVVDATGKLAGATGELTFAGVQAVDGSFTETVTGSICLDLGGNGKP